MIKGLQLKLPIAKSETNIALAALLADLVIIAFLPILLKVSEYEIRPNATIFNRCFASH